ncbi:glycerophosphodiester phosphodiesterase [Qipengyuania sp. 6B39]|uniref:glycerophosphodiester phosphodiesterase family protein n=1 Tax=Qipengyuania proteolytica TaxID=2867239 RepID=UPI001C8948EA|nr:glycerophosphodiester phosphodiesterase family protein [Qipengyuania proteolytica]MBX7494532.1 glycerophosphodiester phosphodiesterase [Qipengyuania proteolytica]
MKTWLKRLGLAGAVLFLVLTLVNASWLAPDPTGSVKLIAHRGLYQQYDKTGVGRDTCTADRLEQPVHDYLENTTRSIARAAKLGAWFVEVDIAPTKDGRIAVFQDWTVDCRTDGSGETRDLTLAQLKALDAGFGYTADGGKTFPFRGKGVGAIPTLDEALAASGRARLLYNFKSKDPAEADLLAAALKAAGRDTSAKGDAFYGAQGPVDRIRTHFPEAWAFSMEEGKACTKAYLALGWSGYVPEACRGGTIFVPLNYQWAFWGWPNRMIARMDAVGARIMVLGPQGEGRPRGLDLPEQLGAIPASFNGYAMVDDTLAVIPALFPRFDDRRPQEFEVLQAGLERRRVRRGD